MDNNDRKKTKAKWTIKKKKKNVYSTWPCGPLCHFGTYRNNTNTNNNNDNNNNKTKLIYMINI